MRGLYAIIDPSQCKGRDPVWVSEQTVRSGCTALQLRVKTMSDRAFLKIAQQVQVHCKRAGVQFWVNDRLDIALLSRADGLFLSQDDLAVDEVRQVWGPRLLGLSVDTLQQAKAAENQGVDLIGYGPVFRERTPVHQPEDIGLFALAEVCRAVRTPVLAIGGIQRQHARLLRRTGASYAASVRLVCGAADPRAAAFEFHQALITKRSSMAP
ncbi:MAG: thiamine phosphate synthase [Myxococcales bacterium]